MGTGSVQIRVMVDNPVVARGDVNLNGSVDIIDALMIAQYAVGSIPEGFNVLVADVDNNGNINIVDALMVAQYYVGILPGLP